MSHSQWNASEMRGGEKISTSAIVNYTIWKPLDFKQIVSSGNARLRSNSFLDNTRAFTNVLEDSLDVEDTGHVIIEHLLTNLLFSVFSSFVCPFHVNCVFIPSKSLSF